LTNNQLITVNLLFNI